MKAFVLLLTFAILSNSQISIVDEFQKITANPPGDSNSQFGFALDRFGQDLIIGAPQSGLFGTIYYYQFNGTGFSFKQKVEPLTLENDSKTGFTVSIHGNHSVAGAPQSGNGVALIIKRNSTGTWEITQTLVGGGSPDLFGYSAYMTEADMIIGSPLAEPEVQSGAAYMYEKGGSTWSESFVLYDVEGDRADLFGMAVHMTSDGTKAVIGAPNHDEIKTNDGAVFVAEKTGNIWQITHKLLAPVAQTKHNFGISVAISDVGYIVVGANLDNEVNGHGGAVFVFRWDMEQQLYVQTQKILAFDGSSNDHFGTSVDVLEDASYLIVGAQNWASGSGQGAAYLYKLEQGQYQIVAFLQPSDADNKDQIGADVDLYRYGDSDKHFSIMLGAFTQGPGSPRGPGAVYTMYLNGTQDCVGIPEGNGYLDECGVCNGNNSSCTGCDGVPNSHKIYDDCGVCGGDLTTCVGCDGIPNSGLMMDFCGVCGGDNSTCVIPTTSNNANSSTTTSTSSTTTSTSNTTSGTSTSTTGSATSGSTTSSSTTSSTSSSPTTGPQGTTESTTGTVISTSTTTGASTTGNEEPVCNETDGCTVPGNVSLLTFGGENASNIYNCDSWCHRNFTCTNLRYTFFEHTPIWDCRIDDFTVVTNMRIKCNVCDPSDPAKINPKTCYLDVGLDSGFYRFRWLWLYLWGLFWLISLLVGVRYVYFYYL